ncbi:MAG: helicase [Lawsonibacter sp.]|nr:helicase [Lawsonibacter sp.]
MHIYRYVTESTFDAYLWQTLENKQKFISQIMTSRTPLRSCEDVDEAALSYAEIKALCAGDPRIKERMELDTEVARLKIMRADHQNQQFRMEDNLLKYYPQQIAGAEKSIADIQADMETVARHPHPEDGFAGMTVHGTAYGSRTKAGAALLDACADIAENIYTEIGSYRGFVLFAAFNGIAHVLTMKNIGTYRVDLGPDPRGNTVRMDNVLAEIPEQLERQQAQLANLRQQLEATKGEVGKPFPREEELRRKSARLVELNAALNLGSKAGGDVAA